MLFLNGKEITSVDRRLIQDAVSKAYELMHTGNFNMPDRSHVQDGDNTLLLMPCFSTSYFATKLVSVFPGAADRGLPVVNGIMTLADNTSGRPLAVMDGAALTAERTGAVGGLAVSLLTAPHIETAGIFGAGVQGYSQARYLIMNRRIRRLVISDLSRESAGRMAAHFADAYPGLDCRVADAPDALVREADLVIAATTSTTPLFSDDPGLVRGKTFISIGSFRPDMKEFPDAVSKAADRIYVDTPFAAKESGDIAVPLELGIVSKEDIRPFSGIAAGEKQDPDTETVFFKSVGMALFDLAVASALYELAVANNLGVELEF